jgi:YfiH family protein
MSAPEHPCELPGGGRVLFTDRSHGNLSSVSGERSALGASMRERVREHIGVERIARGRQVHGAAVARVIALTQIDAGTLTAADGQATSLAGVGAMVLTADCLPVALGCPGAVAMLHAGWRGLAAGVLEEGVHALGELAGSANGSMSAVIGPGAGACCYEVGPDVQEALGSPSGRRATNIDLRAIARRRLLAAGVADVRDIDECTICGERFFSHRRERARAGRQAGIAWLS